MIVGGSDERGECGDGHLAESEEPDAGDLAGQKAAGGDPGEEDLDDAAGLLFDDAVEDHGAVGRDGHEEQDGHDERGRLVVGAAARDVAELDVCDGDGGEKVGELVCR